MIDFSDFTRARKVFRDFERVAGTASAKGLRKAANIVRKHVRAELKPHRRTGKTAGRVRISYDGKGLRMAATVKSGGPVAHLIAGGVQSHTIAPDKVMALHAAGKKGAVIGFATVVEHPGFRGDPYFDRGVDKSGPEINAVAKDVVKDIASTLARRIR